MGKRSSFRRRKQDRYFTPPEAAVPLVPHLGDVKLFSEPCAGNGALVDILERHGFERGVVTDIEPGRDDIERCDALTWTPGCALDGEYIITNPPWTRQLLHPMIDIFSDIAPTWLLFDAPWMHTKQAIPYLKKCRKIVSVGRVSWMQNGASSLDDCCWYLFDKDECETVFYGKQER